MLTALSFSNDTTNRIAFLFSGSIAATRKKKRLQIFVLLQSYGPRRRFFLWSKVSGAERRVGAMLSGASGLLDDEETVSSRRPFVSVPSPTASQCTGRLRRSVLPRNAARGEFSALRVLPPSACTAAALSHVRVQPAGSRGHREGN
jgi:hypothetical protein